MKLPIAKKGKKEAVSLMTEPEAWCHKFAKQTPKSILEVLAKVDSSHAQAETKHKLAEGFVSFLLNLSAVEEDTDESADSRKRVAGFSRTLFKHSDLLIAALSALQSRIMEANTKKARWNILHFLRHLPSAAKTHNVYPLFGEDSAGEGKEDEEEEAHEPENGKFSHAVRVQALESVWLQFSGLKLSPAMLRLAIPYFVEEVMDHLPSAELFSDFLYAAFNRGGHLAVLSVAGIFKLIVNKHFEHPSFYSDVYFMVQPSVCYSSYARRFFDIVDIILSSSHVPIYVITAFVKRLARTLLYAPLHCQLPLLIMIKNLLRRHEQVYALLINREHPATLETDPYDGEEKDLQRCRADESSLWELKVIQQHWHSKVADKARDLLNHNIQDHEQPVEWLSWDEHFDKLLGKAKARMGKLNSQPKEGDWREDEPLILSKRPKLNRPDMGTNLSEEMVGPGRREQQRIAFRKERRGLFFDV